MNQPDIGALSMRLSNGHSIDLASGAILRGSDLPGLHSVPPGGPVAAVKPHPTDTTILGLQNLSHLPWRVHLPSGDSIEVKPGKNMRLAPGTRIDFGPIDGEVQFGRALTGSKSRGRFWIAIFSAALLLGAAALAGWYFEHRLADEKMRRETLAREEAKKQEQADRAAMLIKQQAEAVAAQQAQQEQARARALAEAAAATPTPSPTPSRVFLGTWIADGQSFGFFQHGDDQLTEKKVRLGSWHAILVINDSERADFTFEFSQHLALTATRWIDMPSPYDKSQARYMKYSTESLEMSYAPNSAVSIVWNQWKLTGWRPRSYPQWAFQSLFPAELPVPKMIFRITGTDELTSADLVFHRR